MKAPILIAACNEEAYIGQTLGRFDAHATELHVIVNGSEDATAEEARRFTPHVYELEDMGKLPAIQYGLRKLGKRAMEPLLFLDADSYPVSPRGWERTMTKAVQGNLPAVASGLIGFRDAEGFGDSAVRSGRRVQQALVSRKLADLNSTFGANMALNIATEEMLERILSMEHTWPGEDRYLTSLVRANGKFTQLVNPASLVFTSARWLPSLRHRLEVGQQAAGDLVKQTYADRRAPGVTHYFREGQLYAYSEDVDEPAEVEIAS